MIEIPLSKTGKKYQGIYKAIIDDIDSDLAELNWSAKVPLKPRVGKSIYAYRYRMKCGDLFLHRAIAERFLGKIPSGLQVDHINKNSLDNRRENLRYLSNAENSKNKSMDIRNSSGYRGVFFCNTHKRWAARIGVNYKKISLGNFKTKEQAIDAVKQWEVRGRK